MKNQQDGNYLLNQKKTILEYVSEHWMVGDFSYSFLPIGCNRKALQLGQRANIVVTLSNTQTRLQDKQRIESLNVTDFVELDCK